MDDNQIIGTQETIANGYNGSSDFSIITGPPSSTNRNGALDLSCVNIAMYNSLQSHTSDMSLEEAVGRVQALMKENQELKVIVEQSNATMNQLSSSLLEWKNAQANEQEEMRRRLDQTKNVVLDLRSQKAELFQKVKDLEDASKKSAEDQLLQNVEEENVKLKDENQRCERLVEEYRLEAAEYKRRLETTPLSLDQLSEGENSYLEAEITSLRNKLDDAVMFKTKAEKLEKECDGFKEVAAELERKLGEVRDSSVLTRDENQDLKKKEAHLREVVKELEMQINTVKKMNQKLDQEKHDLVIINTELESQTSQQNSDNSNREKFKVSDAIPDLEGKKDWAFVQSASNQGSFSDYSQLQVKLQEEESRTAELNARLSEQASHIERLSSDRDRKDQQFQNASLRYRNTMKELKQCHQLDMERLAKENDRLSQSLINIEKESLNSQSLKDDVNGLKAQNLSLVSEVREQESKKIAATKKVDTLRIKNEDIENQVKQLQQQLEQAYAMDDSVVQELSKASQAVEQQFNMEKQEHAATKAQLTDVTRQFNQLLSDYNEQLNLIEDLKIDQERYAQLTMPPSYNEDVFRHFQEQVDNLTGQVMTAEETIHSKNSEIHMLREKISRSSTDTETLPVLQAQCEIYKADFEAERGAREKQHSENCRLHAEIQQLQIRNQQLQDEMENYSKKQLEDMQRTYARQNWNFPNNPNTVRGPPPRVPYPHEFEDGNNDVGLMGTLGARNPVDTTVKPRSPKSTVRAPAEDPEPELICPKCGIECPDMDSLTIHVLDCLDQP